MRTRSTAPARPSFRQAFGPLSGFSGTIHRSCSQPRRSPSAISADTSARPTPCSRASWMTNRSLSCPDRRPAHRVGEIEIDGEADQPLAVPRRRRSRRPDRSAAVRRSTGRAAAARRASGPAYRRPAAAPVCGRRRGSAGRSRSGPCGSRSPLDVAAQGQVRPHAGFPERHMNRHLSFGSRRPAYTCARHGRRADRTNSKARANRQEKEELPC